MSNADTVREARETMADLERGMEANGCLCLSSRCPVHGESTGLLARAWLRLGATVGALAALERERDEAREAWDVFAARMHGAEKRAEAAERERDTLRAALERIERNARAWHGNEGLNSGHARALDVIAGWCDEATSSVRDEQAESAPDACICGERDAERHPEAKHRVIVPTAAGCPMHDPVGAPATPDARENA